MEKIEDMSVSDLLYALERQYPAGVTTFGPCPSCQAGSRGGDFCANCIGEELVSRGVQPAKVTSLLSALDQRRGTNQWIETLTAAIRAQTAAWRKVQGEKHE